MSGMASKFLASDATFDAASTGRAGFYICLSIGTSPRATALTSAA